MYRTDGALFHNYLRPPQVTAGGKKTIDLFLEKLMRAIKNRWINVFWSLKMYLFLEISMFFLEILNHPMHNLFRVEQVRSIVKYTAQIGL